MPHSFFPPFSSPVITPASLPVDEPGQLLAENGWCSYESFSRFNQEIQEQVKQRTKNPTKQISEPYSKIVGSVQLQPNISLHLKVSCSKCPEASLLLSKAYSPKVEQSEPTRGLVGLSPVPYLKASLSLKYSSPVPWGYGSVIRTSRTRGKRLRQFEQLAQGSCWQSRNLAVAHPHRHRRLTPEPADTPSSP